MTAGQGCLLALPSSLQGRHCPGIAHNGPPVGRLLTPAAEGPSSGRVPGNPPRAGATLASLSARIGKQNVLRPHKGVLLSLTKEGNYDSCYNTGGP